MKKRTKISALVGGAVISFILAAQQVIKKEETEEVKEIAKKEVALKKLEKQSKIDPTVKSSTTWQEAIDEITRLEKRRQELKRLANEFKLKMKTAAKDTMWKLGYMHVVYRQREDFIRSDIERKRKERVDTDRNLKALKVLSSLTTNEMNNLINFLTGSEFNREILSEIMAKFLAVGIDLKLEIRKEVPLPFIDVRQWDKREDYLTFAKYYSLELIEEEPEFLQEEMEKIAVKKSEIEKLLSLAETDPELKELLQKEIQALYSFNNILEEYYLNLEDYIAYLNETAAKVRKL